MMDLFHKLYLKSKRCPVCNATYTETDHTCNILGRKIAVADDDDVEGGIAQVIYFNENSNEHLLFYSTIIPETGRNQYSFEVVDLYKENIRWTFHDEMKISKSTPLEEDVHNPENWERYEIKQLGIDSVYLFHGDCMYYIKPSVIEHAGNGAFAARRFEKGETIAYYDGKDVTDAPPKKTDYVLEVEHRRIDGFGAFHGLQYVNDARGSARRNNIRITRNGGFVVMRSNAIPVGRELLVSYGEQYWSTRDESSNVAKARINKQQKYDPNDKPRREIAKIPKLISDNRQSTATTEDISSIKTGNECGLWTIMYILDELYPEEAIDFSRLTSTWFVKMRAHLIYTLLKRITPSFVEIRDGKLYLDNVFIGPSRFDKGDINSIVAAHTMAFVEDRYPSVKTPHGIVEMYAPAFNKLQQGTMIDDAAIRGYLLLCLSEKTKDVLVLDSLMAFGSAVEYLQRCVVRAHRIQSRTAKFVKIFQVINIQQWHWYVLRYDVTADKRIQMRNNITSLQKKGAKRQFEQFVSWYEGFSLECATWGCEHPVGKRDSFCSKHHRTCAPCKEKWIASNKKSPLIRQKKKMGNDKDLHKRLTCPICKEALGSSKASDSTNSKRKIDVVDMVKEDKQKKQKIQAPNNKLLETRVKFLEASVRSLKHFCASHHPKIPSLFTFVWPSQVVQAYHAWSEPTTQSLDPAFGEHCAESVEVVSTKIPNCTFYGVVAKKACPISSWLKFKAYATSSTNLSDYAMTIQKQAYDIKRKKKKWKQSLQEGHYVNELPEDFLFQTMRLAAQMRYFPKQLTKADVNVMLENVRKYWMVLTRLFTDLYIPLKTFGEKYYGPIYLLDDDGVRCRMIIGYTLWGQPKVINDHDNFTWMEQDVTGKSGFVTVLVNENRVHCADQPSPYTHGNLFLHALLKKAKELGCVSPSYTLPSFSPILKPMDILIKAMTPNCMLVPYPLFSGGSIDNNVVARVTAIRKIEAGEEWYVNYKYGSRAERDKDGKPWYPAAWCLSEENLAFQYNAKTWVEMLVHPSVYT